ncbi:hypothetical protein ACVGW1_00550, partial [Enterobacter intestinihominis]
SPGWASGMVYITKQGLEGSTQQLKANSQDLPDSVPDVKGYTGWDHMLFNMDAGKYEDKVMKGVIRLNDPLISGG